MAKLSDDIGKMADRIGEMADCILDMADKIGEMADRIVETEELMSKTLLQMQDNMNGSQTATQSAVLTTDYGSSVAPGEIPVISIAGEPEKYLLYVSDAMVITDDAASVLISREDDLYDTWPDLKKMANNNELYIAVKVISGNTVSSCSNVVMLNVE